MSRLEAGSAPPAIDSSAVESMPTGSGGWQSWRYPADAGARDLRIDFLRGLAIVFVVVDHIHLRSAFYVLSHERIGAVSGAEIFVLLSGVVLGQVNRRRLATTGWQSSAERLWRRAGLLYLVSLVIVIAAFGLSKLPFLDGNVLTTWTDNATGQSYEMYGTTPLLAQNPVPPSAVLDVLLLNVGPFQFNVMGLYVALLLLAPLALWSLARGRWWMLLVVSTSVYVANLFLHWRFLPSSFENPFPLLTWQLPFMVGLIVGYYREQIQAWFGGSVGKTVSVLAWSAFVVFLVFTWNNPAKLGDPLSLRLDLISDTTFWRLYGDWFPRDFLGPLRLANLAVLVITLYGLLIKFWAPAYRLLGWFLVPLGGATLYVFILHVVFALIVASLPFIDETSVAVGTLTHVAILALLWIMVRTSFLFRWIPR